MGTDHTRRLDSLPPGHSFLLQTPTSIRMRSLGLQTSGLGAVEVSELSFNAPEVARVSTYES